MFIDFTEVELIAGHGGKGSIHFRREKFVPKGGPDGGDGGRGGSVWLVADGSLNEFSHLMHRPHLRAAHGAHGRGRDCFGASAEHLEVLVPVGTIVRDDQGNQLADLVEVGQRFEAAKGGRGGLGNLNFVSATNQAPTECTPGEPGEERELELLPLGARAHLQQRLHALGLARRARAQQRRVAARVGLEPLLRWCTKCVQPKYFAGRM